MKKKKEDIKELRHGARRLSIKEGAFSTVRQSLGDSYLTPFAIAINSSNFLIGLITSISGLLGPLSQWFSSRLIEKHSRKRIVVTSTLYESLMWIPLILIGFLFYKGIIIPILPLLFLLFFSFYIIIANIAAPAWFSWIGDLVDENYRGKWFSKRNFRLGFVGLLFTFIAAFFLDYFKSKGWTMFGFMTLFFLAMVARFIAREYFKKSYEPKLVLEGGYYFSFWEFIKKSPRNNFGRYTIFRAFMNFSVAIASPFFAVYMLRVLNFNYVTFTTIILSQAFFGLVIMRYWGKFADRYGNYAIMRITFIFIGIYPLLWLVSPSPIYLVFVPELIGGMAWAGFNLASGNFIFDCVTPQKRGIVLSYYNVLNGVGIFLGAGLGAILIGVIKINGMESILVIFIISAIARLTTGFVLTPHIKEVRKMESFDSTKALKNLVPIKRINHLFEGTYELVIGKRFRWKK
ncbi:MAG: MFS transporter [Nanoarchaeota archaeon]|nr:MFS transporter [Nanoarchaeota archaeon]